MMAFLPRPALHPLLTSRRIRNFRGSGGAFFGRACISTDEAVVNHLTRADIEELLG